MRLICCIQPRADGTVLAHGADGKRVVFEPAGDGQTAAEVPDVLARRLLATGNFYPDQATPQRTRVVAEESGPVVAQVSPKGRAKGAGVSAHKG